MLPLDTGLFFGSGRTLTTSLVMSSLGPYRTILSVSSSLIAEHGSTRIAYKLVNLACGQLNRENDFFPVLVRAWEFGLARQVQPSRPASPHSLSTLRLHLVLIHGVPSTFRDDVQFKTADRHRVSPEFITLEIYAINCVSIAFTAVSRPAQGRQ